MMILALLYLPVLALASIQSEIDIISLHLDTLDAYAHKPDCFRRVASRIRTRCTEVDTSEEERVQAAISMTLCELATARHHSTPLECLAFTTDDFSSKDQDTAGCVEALSRSAQFWSSYSGYLRDIPQLCFALRRWNDIDTAKEIYINATLENISILKSMRSREEYIQKAERDIQKMHTSLHQSSMDITDKMRSSMDQLLVDMGQSLQDFRIQILEREANSIEQMNMAISQLTVQHVEALSAIVPTLFLQMEAVFDQISTESRKAFDVGNHVQSQWAALSSEFALMHQLIHSLTDKATTLTTSLNNTVLLSNVLSTSIVRMNETSSALFVPRAYGWVDLFWHIDPIMLAHLPLSQILLPTLRLLGFILQAIFSLVSVVFVASGKYRSRTADSPGNIKRHQSLPPPPLRLHRRRRPPIIVTCKSDGLYKTEPL